MLQTYIYLFLIFCTVKSFAECVKKYLEDDGSEHQEFSKTVMDEFPDEPAYRKCRSMLNSPAKLESLVLIIFQSDNT